MGPDLSHNAILGSMYQYIGKRYFLGGGYGGYQSFAGGALTFKGNTIAGNSGWSWP